jgi:hypothetical protein
VFSEDTVFDVTPETSFWHGSTVETASHLKTVVETVRVGDARIEWSTDHDQQSSESNERMIVGIGHEGHDLGAFQDRGEPSLNPENTPDNVEVRQFCPATDGSVATRVWDAESLDDLREELTDG